MGALSNGSDRAPRRATPASAARAMRGMALGGAVGLFLALVEVALLAAAPAHRHLAPPLGAAAAVALLVDTLAAALVGALVGLLARGSSPVRPARGARKPVAVVGAVLTVLLGASLWIALSPTRMPGARRTTGPNVVLVTVDALRADAVGAFGAGQGATPELDRIAREGALFRRATSAGSWTLPALASLMTGGFVPSHGVSSRQPVLPRDVRTVAESLSRCGYATAAVVSSTFTRSAFGLDRGFDIWDEEVSPEWQRLFVPRAARRLGLSRFSPPQRYERTAFDGVDAAARLLGRTPPEPFFLWIHLFDPHPDYNPPLPWGAAALAAARPPWDGSVAALIDAEEGRRPMPGVNDLAHLRALYAAEVAYTDAAIGRLRHALEERSVWPRTALIVTADHGEAFLEHGHLLHTDLFQDVLHVPLVVRYPPLVTPGAVVDAVVRTVDVAPTITALTGFPAAWPDGEDLLALLNGPGRNRLARADQDDLPLPAPVRQTRRALVDWPWKLILTQNGAPELYDLAADPGERRNLASSAPDVVVALSRRLPPLPNRSAEPVPPPWVRDEIRARLRSLGYLR